jgi:signal transduction histidine kinase
MNMPYHRVGVTNNRILPNYYLFSNLSLTYCHYTFIEEIGTIDTGESIPAEDLTNIFERFYRVDKSRTRGTGGSGLELTITRRWVKTHGGEMKAQGELRKGSCFSFTIPISEQFNLFWQVIRIFIII